MRSYDSGSKETSASVMAKLLAVGESAERHIYDIDKNIVVCVMASLPSLGALQRNHAHAKRHLMTLGLADACGLAGRTSGRKPQASEGLDSRQE